MVLIIGGAYQGKTKYAMEKYGGKTIVNQFHNIVKEWIKDGKNPIEETKAFITGNPDSVVIIDEIGSGIIPMEKSERIFRETVGRVGCMLAKNAKTVERITLGIAVKIK